MARPLKQGLDYFPLDCQLDLKFELIEAEFGLTGFGVIVKLFQQIYGQHGYYTEWTDEVALLFANKVGLGGSVVSEIIQASIRRGIFDKELYGKYHILTSAGIQKRYLEAVSRRKSFKIKEEYLLVSYAQNKIFDNNNGVNVDINSINAGNNSESKGEKRREKEIIGEEKTKTLTPQQKQQLISEFGEEIVEDYIRRTSEYNCCCEKNIREWIRQDREKNRKRNKFGDFPQRKYTASDYSMIEEMLLKKIQN